MKHDSMEISDKGMKISYRRYLSDNAPGFIILLALIVSLYTKTLFFGMPVGRLVSENILNTASPQPGIPDGLLVFVLLILFLLAPPFGLILNTLSWMLLEGLQGFIEWWGIYKNPVLFFRFKAEYLFSEIQQEYNIKSRNDWSRVCQILQVQMGKKEPLLTDRLEPIRGLAIFCRNLAFLAFLGIWAFQIPLPVGLILGLIFIISSSVTHFYYRLQLACWNMLVEKNISAHNVVEKK
jgi:hypothetical protein